MSTKDTSEGTWSSPLPRAASGLPCEFNFECNTSVSDAPVSTAPHRTPHPLRLPRPVLDPVAWIPRLAAHQEPVPAAQRADRLTDLHVIDLDAVGSERFTYLEPHAGSSYRDGSRADPA